MITLKSSSSFISGSRINSKIVWKERELQKKKRKKKVEYNRRFQDQNMIWKCQEWQWRERECFEKVNERNQCIGHLAWL